MFLKCKKLFQCKGTHIFAKKKMTVFLPTICHCAKMTVFLPIIRLSLCKNDSVFAYNMFVIVQK